MRARHLYGVYAISNILWSLVSAAAVAAPAGPALSALWAVWFTAPIVSALCLVAFASQFTGRNWRQNRILRGLTVVAAVLIPFLLTTPFHDLYWRSMTVVTEPFAHLHYSFGIVGLAAVLLIVSAFAVTYYYFVELYLKSRHRPSSAMMIIVLGFVLGLVPFVLSRLDIGLVSTYDHTSFGIVFAAVSFAFAAFRLELADVTPLARDEAIEDLSDPYLAVDDAGRLVDYNDAARTVLDISDGDIGTQLADIAPIVGNIIDSDRNVFKISTGGTERHFDLNTSPIKSESRTINGRLIVLRDITARKEREQELERTKQELEQSNEKLAEFASLVSHDLRNPLTVILGRARLVDRDQENEEHLEAIDRSATRMQQMITDLLALSRAGKDIDSPETVSLHTVVQNSWDSVQPEGTDLDLCVPQNSTVDADRERLQTVFENLFRNAREHNEPPLTIRVGLLDGVVADGDNGSAIGFFVADSGDGIPVAEREVVFEHGYTTNRNGTGFGLSIVKEIVTAHGWSISICDSENSGTRFEVVTGTIEK